MQESNITTVTSRKSISLYGMLICSLLLYNIFLGPGIIKNAFKGNTIDYPQISLGILLFIFGLYSIHAYNKQAPTVIVTEDGISFNKRKYLWNEVTNVAYSGKMPFRYLLTYGFEGMSIAFSNGNTEYLHNTFYSNIASIKRCINHHLTGSLPLATPHIITASTNNLPEPELSNDQVEYYKGNQLTTMVGAFAWIIVSTATVAIFMLHESDISIPIFLFCFFLFGILTRRLNYFGISAHHIIVRNHNIFWNKQVFRLDSINKIIFDAEGKAANSLRIIFKNFEMKTFQGASLSNEKWLALQKRLEERGIAVTDENYFAQRITPTGKKTTKLMIIMFLAYFIFFGISITLIAMANLSDIATKLTILITGLLEFVAMLRLFRFLAKKHVDNNSSE